MGCLCGMLGGLGGYFGTPWANFATSVGYFGSSWGTYGVPWWQFRLSSGWWSCFDVTVSHFRPTGNLCDALCRLGVSLWIVGEFWEPFWNVLGYTCIVCGLLRVVLGYICGALVAFWAIIGLVFGEAGFKIGATIEGTKYTKIIP